MRPASLRLFAAVLPCLVLAGCGFFHGQASEAGRQHRPGRFAGKKLVAVAYEGRTDSEGLQENVFRLDTSMLIDKALLDLGCEVLDRARIQGVLTGGKLPESGSFRQEDLDKMQSGSQADILIMGYVLPAERSRLILPDKAVTKAVLRAVDLRTYRIISYAEDELADAGIWAELAADLARKD